jgi:hypothetical protein
MAADVCGNPLPSPADEPTADAIQWWSEKESQGAHAVVFVRPEGFSLSRRSAKTTHDESGQPIEIDRGFCGVALQLPFVGYRIVTADGTREIIPRGR